MFDRRGSRKYLNRLERRAFLQVNKHELDAMRRAFCRTLFHTGCRISEALNLTAGQIDLTGKSIVFETLKRRGRGHFRAVPVPDSLVGLLGKIMAGKAPKTKVWDFSRTTAYRLVKTKMKQAKITGGMASPKGLRHGFAVACLAQKIPLTTVKKWLGHARLETTAIYLEVSGDEERELAERLWSAEGKET
jgi:integrase